MKKDSITMLNIVFCDIDGVLNNKTSQTMYFSGDDSKYGIDSNNLNNLKIILNKTKSKIIWSTNWRNHPYDFSWGNDQHEYKSPFFNLRKMMKDYEYSPLPCCPHVHNRATKFEDIISCLQILQIDYQINFVVIDDMLNQGLYKFDERFFETDPKFGLTKTISSNVIRQLKKLQAFEFS